MPISTDFRQRLYPHLAAIAAHFGTPFHIYDEVGIRQTVRHCTRPSTTCDFHEYFAVKALPNPHILRIVRELASASIAAPIPELMLARQVGARARTIMFTCNNTTPPNSTFAAADGGCILNLDDVEPDRQSAATCPDRLSFRYNPGAAIRATRSSANRKKPNSA